MKTEVIKLHQKLSQFNLGCKSRRETIMKAGSSLVLFVVLTLAVIVNNFAQTPSQPTGNAGSDLSGSYPNPTVQKLNGRPLSKTAPAVGDTLRWNGTAWEPAKILSNSGSKLNAESGLSLNGLTLSAQNTRPIWNANQIAGRNIKPTAATTGQALKWNGTEWVASPMPQAVPIQTFFKSGINWSPVLNVSEKTFTMTELSHTVILTKRSRLVISAMIDILGENCLLQICRAANAIFTVQINDKGGFGFLIAAASGAHSSATISNAMIDLDPGTHQITVEVTPLARNNLLYIATTLSVKGLHSSIMVIPLE